MLRPRRRRDSYARWRSPMSRRGWAVAFGACALGVVGCGSRGIDPLAGSDPLGESRDPIISGTDDREDIYQLAGQTALTNVADGVGVLVYSSYLTTSSGTVDLAVGPF